MSYNDRQPVFVSTFLAKRKADRIIATRAFGRFVDQKNVAATKAFQVNGVYCDFELLCGSERFLPADF